MPSHYFIVYISPYGSTRLLAQDLSRQLAERGQDVALLDLADVAEHDAFLTRLAAAEEPCVLVGSPVYRDRAAPPVMSFVERMPDAASGWAAPFVTWGLACSGVALWQMARALGDKGYRLAGAAKVAAVHCLMTGLDDPCGAGHPDASDRRQIRKLADALVDSISEQDLASLDYQPEPRAQEQKAALGQPWAIIPKKVHEHECTQCGTCEAGCPVGAVVLDPYPRFGPDCFDCFRCVRGCPESAIETAISMKQLEELILSRVEGVRERPLTWVFG